MSRARRGRKRKDGERQPCGKLKQTFDRGSPGVQRRVAIYGAGVVLTQEQIGQGRGVRETPDTFDAIGRAYLGGLLNGLAYSPEVARDAARDVAALYWRIFGIGAHRDSLAKFMPQGASGRDRERALEGALNARLARINALGRDVRKAFDALVLDNVETDHGPAWVDRIIFARRKGIAAPAADEDRLALALRGIEAVC